MLRAARTAAKPILKLKSPRSMCKVGHLKISPFWSDLSLLLLMGIGEKNIPIKALLLKGKAALNTDREGQDSALLNAIPRTG